MNIYDDYISCHELKKILKGPKYKTLRNKINNRGIRISLDGNVGSGKSTVINFFKKLPSKYDVYEEDPNKWVPWLNLYFKDSKKNATYLQFFIILYFRDLINKSIMNKTNIIGERIGIDDKIFFKLAYDNKNVTDDEYNLYMRFHKLLVLKPDIRIYLQTKPKISFERLKNRNRNNNKLIPYDWIKSVHKYHEKVYNPKKYKVLPGKPRKYKNIFIINSEQDREGVKNDLKSVLEGIKKVKIRNKL